MYQSSSYLFAGFESRHSGIDLVMKSPGGLGAFLLQLVCQGFCGLDRIGHTPPCVCLQCWITFAINAEGGVVAAFDQPVSTLVTVAAPWLDAERLIGVVFVTLLLIALFDGLLDDVGGVEDPEDQRTKENQLIKVSARSIKRIARVTYSLCRSHGVKGVATVQRVVSLPFLRPLRLVGVDSLF